MTLPVEEQAQARAVRELQSAAGGVEASGSICEKSPSLHSCYQSPQEPRSIPLRDVERLESVTHGHPGHPHVTRYLARKAGFSLVRRPAVPADRAAILDLLARQAREQGECDPELLAAIADGAIDAAEAARLIPLFHRRLETTAQMLAELEAIAGAEQ